MSPDEKISGLFLQDLQDQQILEIKKYLYFRSAQICCEKYEKNCVCQCDECFDDATFNNPVFFYCEDENWFRHVCFNCVLKKVKIEINDRSEFRR